ncbi:hypothetical protein IQ235_00880 [Oscillatoriales cyanobacterium LEGE 11467]|uniref:Uncharacterized protein n=1 Tax=Zarconia navalis LEGE 11467 TaxID=1828826 RepID=A0A928VS31_9CYAN|nr:hypothetical protein [Zarconia navalis]MBE9039349.1 hypothetical protein [Zarconia navalis LEGE 11467]
MAQSKSKDIGILPPAIFDLKTVSTPISYQSEAGIDTQGYDPAWDDPEFYKPKSEPGPVLEKLSPSANADESPFPNSDDDPRWKPEEFGELKFVPESDGQLTIATRKPSNPDDYPTTEAYDRAWVTWSANREAAPKPVTPEVVEADPTAIDGELSYDEKRDRLHLERKVERAFYEAGRALRELRDRRLYRSTHKTFENYCRDRFGYSRRKMDYLIAGVEVVDNLEMRTNCSQNLALGEMRTNCSQNPAISEMRTNGTQILPTRESQVRSLVQLEPEQQREVWQQAVTEAGGKVPSGRIVKDIVERMQQVESPPKQPTRAHHLTLQPWGLVEVSCPNNAKIHARLGRIAAVREKTVEVWLRDVDTMTMNKHTLKHHQVEAVPMERAPGLRELCDRFARLREQGLDPFELEVLALLERSVVLTPVEMGYLEGIEKWVL